jgi:uncharacterized membrane protein
VCSSDLPGLQYIELVEHRDRPYPLEGARVRLGYVDLRRVVLVEYPREGLYALGFVTGLIGGSLQAGFDEPMLSVFIPTAPNPTTGWYAVVPERSVRDLDLSVEDAFRTIISAGIVSPDDREPASNRSFSSLLAQLRAPQLS